MFRQARNSLILARVRVNGERLIQSPDVAPQG